MGSNFNTNFNFVYSCKDHETWCPKYRRKVLVNSVDTRLTEIIHPTAQEWRATGIELEVMPDHVHRLCEVDPPFSVHRMVRYLRGRSSNLMRHEFPWLRSCLATLRANSYFVATVGGAPLAVIKQYIANQKGV